MSIAGRERILSDLRTSIARLGSAGGVKSAQFLPFGLPEMDGRLAGGGLALGGLHEVSEGGDSAGEWAATATLFVAGIVARLDGPVLWCLKGRDLFAPALARVGLPPDRIIYCETWRDADVLPAMEEGLKTPGLGAVVGELARIPSIAARRLQLAAEKSGVTALVIRRLRLSDEAYAREASVAVTRWRISATPAQAPDGPWMMRARWNVQLVRGRGTEPMSMIVEACDAQGRLAVVADLEHGSPAQKGWRQAAA